MGVVIYLRMVAMKIAYQDNISLIFDKVRE